VDLACVEIDVRLGDGARPAEARVRVAPVRLVVPFDVRIATELLVDPDRTVIGREPEVPIR
jgi:hypothetical protein